MAAECEHRVLVADLTEGFQEISKMDNAMQILNNFLMLHFESLNNSVR